MQDLVVEENRYFSLLDHVLSDAADFEVVAPSVGITAHQQQVDTVVGASLQQRLADLLRIAIEHLNFALLAVPTQVFSKVGCRQLIPMSFRRRQDQ